MRRIYQQPQIKVMVICTNALLNYSDPSYGGGGGGTAFTPQDPNIGNEEEINTFEIKNVWDK